MSKIKLITDSTCDLSEELLNAYHIKVIPLYVNFGEISYQDGVDLNTDQMYEQVEKRGVVPKTSAASPGDFEVIFKTYLKEDYDIIYLGIGSKFSATLQNAHLAKKMLESDRIHLLDSQNLSSGSGLLLLKAAQFIEAGDDAKTVAEKITALTPYVRSQFILDTLEYLHKGGRLKAISALVGTMIRLKPIIRVINGEMAVGKKPKGKLRSGIKVLLNDVLKDKNIMDNDAITITHSHADAHVDYIKTVLKQETKVRQIYETKAGCVISSHCGPKTIGVLYIVDPKKSRKKTD